MAVKLKTDITFQSTEVTTTFYRNKEPFMQCRGNEIVNESANASIGNPINDFLLQSRESETITESANASIGNPSNDSLLQSRESETITESTNASINSHSLESLMKSRGSETITESTNASIDSHSLESLMQSRGSETINESANASIDCHSLESFMQSRGSETITESANAGIVAGRESDCIICNWTFLKENITPDYIRDDLISTGLIDRDDCDERGYHDKSRQRKIDHLLTYVVCNIGSSSDLEKFINIFETDHKFIANKLKLPIEVPDWSKGVKNAEKCRHRLETNRKLIEKELKKPQKLLDDFLENFVFDIGDHGELCDLTGGRKKMAECFVDKVLKSVEKGSYDLLLHILKREMCNVPHVYQRIVVALEKTPDQSVPETSVGIIPKSVKLYKSNEDNTPRTDVSEDCIFTITIKGDEGYENLIRKNAMRMDAIMLREFGALPTHVTDGSVVIHLKSVDGDIISMLTDSIRRGQFVRLIEELFSCQEANSSIPSGHWSVDFIIELDNSSSKMKLPATPLKFIVKTGDHRLQLLHANKAFLQEEIDPLTLLEAFSKRGFDHFKEANIEIIPERRLRTDKFLDILEKESDQLMEVFIKILEDQNMNFVLKRLKLYQKMQLIDATLLKKNIIKHIVFIVDELDLEDIKDEIISRCGLHGDVVEELHSQYPEGSEGRIIAMIVDILGQGDWAVCMFIDILFNSGIDSSLLEELSDIEQVSDVTDSMDDNAFVVIREVPKRGLIFQCEVEVIVEVKDGKSKSNKESILHNWKTLKQCIEPVDFVPELERCNFLPKSSFENLGSKSRSHQATLVLIKVYRQVQSSEKEYQKFVEILRRYNGIAADALSNAVGGPINKSETVDKHIIEQTREFKQKIRDKLKRNPEVLLEITDNFIECGLLDIDEVENILHSPKEAAQLLVEFVITNIHLGAYNRLLETLKSETIFRGLVSDLTTAGDREDVNTGTTLQPSATLLSSLFDLPNINQTQSEQQTTESVQHTMNETIIAANRSFLIQTINTMALGRAFKNQGITCFDDLDGTLGRQKRAEHFLNILEKNNLLDQLLDILREQGMTYVLDRLNNCRSAYSADPHILRSNISNNHSNILDNLEIDDVRDIFIKRKVFSSSMFNGIEKKYSRRSGKQMSTVLIEIMNSGPRAMKTLVDVLYINQLDSLADSILRGTPNELQEMKGCTQTDDKLRKQSELSASIDLKLLEISRLTASFDDKLRKQSELSASIDLKLLEISRLTASFDERSLHRGSAVVSKSYDEKHRKKSKLVALGDERSLHRGSSVVSKCYDERSLHRGYAVVSKSYDERSLHRGSAVVSKSYDDMRRLRVPDVFCRSAGGSSMESGFGKSSGESGSGESSLESWYDEGFLQEASDSSVESDGSVETDDEKIRHKASDVVSKSVDPYYMG